MTLSDPQVETVPEPFFGTVPDRNSACNSPCVTLLAESPTREAEGLADQCMKKPILIFLSLSKPF